MKLPDVLCCKPSLSQYFFLILLQVIKKGMSECFGEKNWAKHCCIKPPWTAISDCLTVLEKHGLSICCKQIPKTHFTKAVKEVQMFFVSQEKGKKVDKSHTLLGDFSNGSWLNCVLLIPECQKFWNCNLEG